MADPPSATAPGGPGACSPPPPSTSPPPTTSVALRLLDLHDDDLGLIAACVWAGGGGGADGLLRACRRTRRVGLAALPSVTIRWCDACCREAGAPPPPTANGGGAHPPPLDVRLPSLTAFLAAATGVRVVRIVGEPLWNGVTRADPPCARPASVRQRVWRAVGAALGGRPLGTLRGDGAVVAVLAGRSAAGPAAPTRSVQVAGVHAAAVGELVAALRSVAPSLTRLTVRLAPEAVAAVGALFRSVGRLPALRHLHLSVGGGLPPSGELGGGEAAALAAACRGLTSLDVRLPLGRGFGPPWAATRGALPALTTLHLADARRQPVAPADVAAILAARPMHDVRLPSMAADTTHAVIRALRSVDRLPAFMMFTPSLSAAYVERLLGDAPAAAGVESLSLPVRARPELLLPSLAPLPRLHTLSLFFTIDGVEPPDVHAAGTWGVPPALRRLFLFIRHEPVGGVADGAEARSALALMRWLLAAVAASPAAGGLQSLSLDARMPPGAALDAALAPVVAAGAGALRHVAIRVKPIADDGVGKRRRTAAALAAALPGATITVDVLDI